MAGTASPASDRHDGRRTPRAAWRGRRSRRRAGAIGHGGGVPGHRPIFGDAAAIGRSSDRGHDGYARLTTRMNAPDRVGYTRAGDSTGRPARGWFITIEGPEGAGKTTQATALAEHLARPRPATSTLTREPGGTWLGERIREVLLARTDSAGPTDPLTDALLFNAARRQLVDGGHPAGARRRARPSSAPGSPTRRSPTRATAPGVPLDDAPRARGDRDRRPQPGPDDPARPAGRDRPRAQGARRRDPLRGRVRPRLPPPRPGRVPGPRGRRAGPVRGRRREPAGRRGRRARWPPLPTGWSSPVNRNGPRMRTHRMTQADQPLRLRASSADGRRGSGRARASRRR